LRNDSSEAAMKQFRDLGNAAYSSGEYTSAVRFYERAIAALKAGGQHDEQSEHRTAVRNKSLSVLHGNKAASLMMLQQFRAALNDALEATKLGMAVIRDDE
jgi:hypothetical protein